MNGYIDMHCDTLYVALGRHIKSITQLDNSMLDIGRLLKSGVGAQFFAMFLSQQADGPMYGYEVLPPLEDVMQDMYKVFQQTLSENKETLAFAGSYRDYLENRKAGKLSAVLTLENGYPVLGRMENLERLHEMGVRLITLTWNDPNCFGQNHSTDPTLAAKGLTDFGKEALLVMNDLGIIIDVAHLNDGGIADVCAISKKPFVASHSNCRALAPHSRNLTDEQIRLMANKGGVAGLNFCANFLNQDITDNMSRIERMCDHVEHFIKVGGCECVGIGTDFDGIGSTLEITQCTEMYKLFDAFHRRGISDDQIDRIRYGNVERVMKESMF